MKPLPLLLFLTASIRVAFGAAFVVPDLVQNPNQMIAPFLSWSTDAPSLRYQQVYQASGFFGLGTSPFLINELVFYPSGASPTPTAVLPDVRIDFSTTSKAADALSTVFADNVGANDTVVYSGALNFFLSAPGVYRILLQTPFLFDPSAGNLLMEVRNFQTVPPPPGGIRAYNEAEVTLGDGVSGAFAGDVNALRGSVGTGGLVTGLVGTLVPEPATWALLLTAGVVYALTAHRRTHRARASRKQT
jgi:hypothetical protein